LREIEKNGAYLIIEGIIRACEKEVTIGYSFHSVKLLISPWPLMVAKELLNEGAGNHARAKNFIQECEAT